MNLRQFLATILGLRARRRELDEKELTERGDHLSDAERKLIRERARSSFARAFNKRARRP